MYEIYVTLEKTIGLELRIRNAAKRVSFGTPSLSKSMSVFEKPVNLKGKLTP